MSSHDRLEKTAAIVLGGGLKKVKVQGQTWYEPEAQAKERLDKAYALFEQGRVDVIITTGKYSIMASIDPGVAGPKTEAEVGKSYLITKAAEAQADHLSHAQQDIEACIFYENQSVDTIGNAWFVKKDCLEPLGIRSCIVVTSDYHIERARTIFEWVLGPEYTVACAEAPSHLSDRERARRNHFEQILTDHLKTRLVSAIPAGDDEKIQQFMEGEHQR
ncbi:MAG: YdcF family protein, partial [Anaerolineae bacterium]|nr:YdcF family protein [Anaerolineae bacterium]